MLMGLLQRERTGRSQKLLTTMLCSNAYVNIEECLAFDGQAAPSYADSDLLGLSSLYRLYEASEGWVFLGCARDADWDALVSAADNPKLGAERFASEVGRAAHADALAHVLDEMFRSRTASDWESMFWPAGVPCVRADTGLFAAGPDADPFSGTVSPVVFEEGLRVEVTHPSAGKYSRHGVGVSLSRTPGEARPGCLAGEHSRPILSELGFDADDIERMHEAGTVASP